MERTTIVGLGSHIGEMVSISGWVDVRRDHGKLVFLDIRDRSGKVQVICLPDHTEVLTEAQKINLESVITIEGIVNERPEKMRTEGTNGNIELEALSITILAQAQELPFPKDEEVNLDTYLDNLPLTLRSERARAIFKVQAEIANAYRGFLGIEGFTEFQAPKLIGDDAEGGADVFSVPYFNGKTAHLGTSPQFYKQIMVGVLERVYTIGNVYRAEKHSTTRHINEYTSMDMEMGFITDHRDIMNFETRLLHAIIKQLQMNCEKEFELLGAMLPNAPETFPALKLREALELIYKETGRDNRNEPDLEPEDERWLCEWAAKEKGSDFIFITHYPVSKRPMYTMEDENDPGYTKSFDLLFRGVEITTGGQRRHDYNNLVAGFKMKGLDPEKFSYYLQAFKYGMPPHGGWGMGLERLTQKMLGLANVKEATLFPRDINRIDILLSSNANDAPEN
ncbi:aspartate--tRNA(Asn) ligase [Candidatus Kaiserbacteria bacterium RIFOXYD1_FULL_47_14]|uniref:Aspartate--tRNA ligase n=1 Tax=Candidatus Kaiserbacteria bacterium RIFOXYD1_FULL_47_14 TaxID=1798533 RepID=A0A1F6G3T8_9BACT|nr:MAG: aspartate--tRNA(Asn) ligase [Candidatus Kaiserbacteria bacterium RIFOXYD1_FULL_47_14]